MNLSQMKYFVYVADFRSFTKAAAILRTSQPALSRQLKLLEEELGVKLLHRRSHGVSLTLEGARFLERCTRIINEHESILRDFKHKGGSSGASGSIAVGMPVSLTRTFASFVEAFAAKYPAIRLRVVEGYSALLHEWVVSSSIDFALLFGPRPSKVVEMEPLATEELFVVVSAETGFKHLDTVPGQKINGLKIILPDAPHFLRNVAHNADLIGSGSIRADAHSLMIQLANANAGFTVLPLSAIENEIASGKLVALRLPQVHLSWDVALSYSSLKPLSKAQLVVRNSLRTEVERLIKGNNWHAKIIMY